MKHPLVFYNEITINNCPDLSTEQKNLIIEIKVKKISGKDLALKLNVTTSWISRHYREAIEIYDRWGNTPEGKKKIDDIINNPDKYVKNTEKDKIDKSESNTKYQGVGIYQLFKEGMSLIDIAIKLKIDASEIEKRRIEYWTLRNMGDLEILYNEFQKKTQYWRFAYNQLYEVMEANNMSPTEFMNHLDLVKNFEDFKNEIENVKEELEEFNKEKTIKQKEINEKREEAIRVIKAYDELKEEFIEINDLVNNRKAQKEHLDQEGVADRVIKECNNTMNYYFLSSKELIDSVIEITVTVVTENLADYALMTDKTVAKSVQSEYPEKRMAIDQIQEKAGKRIKDRVAGKLLVIAEAKIKGIVTAETPKH